MTFVLSTVADRTAGPALAGGGLFVAAAFAGTLDVPLWIVLAGLALALVVWDAGSFGAALGREVGRRARTRRVELLHGLWSVAVGLAGAVTARLLAWGLPANGSASAELTGASVGLLAAVGAVVLLVMALR